MTEIVGVRFKKVGKVYYFSPAGLTIEKGANVIVETSRGVEIGEVVLANKQVPDEKIVPPLKNVLRVAAEDDMKVVLNNEKKEKEAFKICQKKIGEHGLEMNLVAAEYTFDQGKLLFYFTADGRVDFRELVKDLASVFHTRIELRQIGVRDEAKMIGGLGICGNPLCCATFLDDFQPVSISMAKTQNLSLNPAKISGTCGRLMCCLKYEHEAYSYLLRATPAVDSVVETPQGTGTVVEVTLLRGECKVRLDKSPDTPKSFPCNECRVLHAGRRHGEKRTEPQVEADEAAEADDSPVQDN